MKKITTPRQIDCEALQLSIVKVGKDFFKNNHLLRGKALAQQTGFITYLIVMQGLTFAVALLPFCKTLHGCSLQYVV